MIEELKARRVHSEYGDHYIRVSLAERDAIISALEAVPVMKDALCNINRKASPDPERTMSEASNDLYWCACEARQALAALEPKPERLPPLTLSPIHIRLLKRGVAGKYISLDNDASVKMTEMAALGELRAAGLARATDDPTPPGPPLPTPYEVTEAGRAALAALEGK